MLLQALRLEEDKPTYSTVHCSTYLVLSNRAHAHAIVDSAIGYYSCSAHGIAMQMKTATITKCDHSLFAIIATDDIIMHNHFGATVILRILYHI